MRLELGGEFLLRLHEPCVVDLPLLVGHLVRHLALDLVGQFFEHVLLEAAQDERRDVAQEVGARVRIFGAYDGRFELRLEVLAALEVAGHEEVEDRPEFGQAVLDRRARESEGGIRPELFYRLCRLRRGVFDLLRLVEEDMAEMLLFVEVDVAAQHVVRRDDDVGVLESGRKSRLAFRFCAGDDGSFELGRELFNLFEPVVHQRRRRDDEGGRLSLLAVREQKGDDLQGLAESHVVGEDAAEPIGGERREPREARLLVVAQHALERFGRLDVGVDGVLDVAHDALETLASREADALVLLGERVEVERLAKRQADVLRVGRLLDAGALDEVGETCELLVAERHEGAVLEPVVDSLLAVRAQHADELGKVELRRVKGHIEEVFVVDRDADRHGGHAAHRLFVEGIGVVDVGDLGKFGQGFVEEEEALRLVTLHEAAVLGQEAVGVEEGEDRRLARRVADEAAAARRFLRRFARERVEFHFIVVKFETRGDAVPVVVEVDGGGKRHDFVAFGEGGRDLHLGDLLDLGQDRAEEGGDVRRGDGERARGAEGFEQRVQGGGESGRHMVDRIFYKQEVRVVVQIADFVRQHHEAAAARSLGKPQFEGGRSLDDLDGALLVHARPCLKGSIGFLHEREETHECARRELDRFAFEDGSAQASAVCAAVVEAAHFILPEVEQEAPEHRRDAGREGRCLRIDSQFLAEFDGRAGEEGAHEFLHAAHDVEPLAPDAKLQPAVGAAIVALEKEVRLKEDGRLAKSGGQKLLRCVQMRVLLGACEAVKDASCGFSVRPGCGGALAFFFELACLYDLQECNDMLAGAVVEGGSRACAVVGLDFLARLVEAHAHLVVLRAFDGRDVDGGAGAAQELRHAPILEVAAALAV